MWNSVAQSRRCFALVLTVWICVLLGSASAGSLQAPNEGGPNPQGMSQQPPTPESQRQGRDTPQWGVLRSITQLGGQQSFRRIVLALAAWLHELLRPLALATIGALIVYIFILSSMVGQQEEMRKAATAAQQAADVAERTLIATQRAWISVEASVGAPLVFDQNGASTSIAFRIKNVGNSPATHITPHVRLGVLKEGGPYPLEEQTRGCSEVRQGPIGLGFTLFPGQSFPESQGLASGSWGVNISQEEIGKGRQVSADKKHIALFIVGCIDYTFPSDPEHHHQTGFIFDLLRFVKGIPVAVINPDDGQIPADNLRLMDSPFGVGRFAD